MGLERLRDQMTHCRTSILHAVSSGPCSLQSSLRRQAAGCAAAMAHEAGGRLMYIYRASTRVVGRGPPSASLQRGGWGGHGGGYFLGLSPRRGGPPADQAGLLGVFVQWRGRPAAFTEEQGWVALWESLPTSHTSQSPTYSRGRLEVVAARGQRMPQHWAPQRVITTAHGPLWAAARPEAASCVAWGTKLRHSLCA